jgi:acetyl-CoA C-acetyltransferase
LSRNRIDYGNAIHIHLLQQQTGNRRLKRAGTHPMDPLSGVFVYDAIRTPRGRGKSSGKLHTQSPLNLIGGLLKQLRLRNPGIEQNTDEIILGCCEQFNDQGGNLARSSALQAGFDVATPGLMVSRFCGSGLDAINTGAAKIMAGQADLVVAGGVEMLSLVTIFGSGGPMATDIEFKDKVVQIPQGLSADLIATLEGYSREDLDHIGALSQQRAYAAWSKGWFRESVIPVTDENGFSILESDELVRDSVTVESLASLKPSFVRTGEDYSQYIRFRYPQAPKIRHYHHAGNSSGIADGAAALLLGNRKIGLDYGLVPQAEIIATASAADDPCIMLTAPAAATKKALSRAGVAIDQIGLFEVNEAFASVVLYFMDKTGVSFDRINVAGGSIAMGHPVGATGSILAGTLIDEMKRRNVEYGVVTMCTGLGMGVATVLKNVTERR